MGAVRRGNFDRLSVDALSSLKGINEPMLVSEVDEVIGPLCRLIDLRIEEESTYPFVIAVSGSVAVGKSTFSRVLRAVLAQAGRTVELVATDGIPAAIRDPGAAGPDASQRVSRKL